MSNSRQAIRFFTLIYCEEYYLLFLIIVLTQINIIINDFNFCFNANKYYY